MSWLNKVNLSSEKKKWLISAAYVALLLVLTYLLFPVRFETNDDGGLRAIMAGFHTQQPYPKTVFTSTLYGQFVCMFYRLFPMVPWYTYIFWLLLYVSFCCICKSLIKVGTEKGVPLTTLLLLYAGLHGALFCYFLWFLQFTVVAGVCVSASLVLLYARREGDSPQSVRCDFALAAILLVFGILIRYLSAIVVLPFLFLAVGWQAARGAELSVLPLKEYLTTIIKNIFSPKSLRLFIGVFLTVIGAFTVLFGYEWYYDALHPEWKTFETFSYYRGLYTDFPNPTYEEAPELYDAIGWSPELTTLVRGWFMLDERITTENFKYIQDHKNEYMAESLVDDSGLTPFPVKAWIQQAAQTMFDTQNGILGIGFLWVILGAVALSVLSISWRKPLTAVWMLAEGGGFCIITLALIIMGRMPLRMYMCILIPAVLLLVLGTLDLQKSPEVPVGKRQKIFLIGITGMLWLVVLFVFVRMVPRLQTMLVLKEVLGVGLAGCFLVGLYRLHLHVRGNRATWQFQLLLPLICMGGILVFAELVQVKQNDQMLRSLNLEDHYEIVNQYMVDHPDQLYIYDSSSSLLFPQSPLYVEQNAPIANLVFYGGSLANSPLFLEQLAETGRNQLTVQNFTQGDVCFLYQVKYGSSSVFPTSEQGEELTQAQREAWVLEQVSKNSVSCMLKSDYGISALEIVDQIGDLYYVYRYLPAS